MFMELMAGMVAAAVALGKVASNMLTKQASEGLNALEKKVTSPEAKKTVQEFIGNFNQLKGVNKDKFIGKVNNLLEDLPNLTEKQLNEKVEALKTLNIKAIEKLFETKDTYSIGSKLNISDGHTSQIKKATNTDMSPLDYHRYYDAHGKRDFTADGGEAYRRTLQDPNVSEKMYLQKTSNPMQYESDKLRLKF